MPNWCSNYAEFRHDDPQEIQRVFDAYKRGELFQQFVPCPSALSEEIPFGDDYAERVKDFEARNMELHGYPSWYEWQVKHWGTKWDIAEVWADAEAPDEGSNMIGVSFDTAWSPPIEFYRTMTDDFGFEIEAHYLEEGVGFVGKYTSADDDNCYELDDMDLATVPKDIRDHWDLDSIMASRAEWAAEQESEESEDQSEE